VNVDVLVKRAQTGDGAAFGQLYERFAPAVYRYLYYQLDGSPDLAEKLAEDVFIEVLERLNECPNGKMGFSIWLLRIAHACLMAHLRLSIPRSISARNSIDRSPGAAEHGLDSRTPSEVALAIGQLTQEQRQAVMLGFFQGISAAEAAQIIGRTEGAILKLQAAGLEGLRNALNVSPKPIASA
jgi:RNA polymerase sigma-70 factor (ECF subfamily)